MKLRDAFHRWLFAAEYSRLHELNDWYAGICKERDELRAQMAQMRPIYPPARMRLEEDLTEQQIADRLAGTNNATPVLAILAKIKVGIVALSDRATDAPHGIIMTRDGPVAPFSNDERLHIAGGAWALAELLRDLQALTQPRTETQKPAKPGA